MKIFVVDLHACTLEAVKELGDAKVYEDGVHFRDEVRKRQADFIAARVCEILKETTVTSNRVLLSEVPGRHVH